MENIVRTVYGADVQSCEFINAPLVIQPNTTLNQKFNFQATGVLPPNAYPSLGYIAIGNGGHSMSVGVGGIPAPLYIPHYPTDAALYNHLPFVLRLPTNDLTVAQQASYRGRTMVTIAGTQYVAYYLKTLVPVTLPVTPVPTPSIQSNSLLNGVTTSTPFVPSVANLSPTPPTIAQQQAAATSGNYVSVSAPFSIVLSAFDVVELVNVSNIIYGSPNFAIISEVALCTGYDSRVTGAFGSAATVTYTEALAVQVAVHGNDFKLLTNSTSGVTLNIDVGASAPMLVLV